jgi:transcriptional regulator with XRE-family HTH domain
MGLLNVIRRMALREQLPIREIARRTGLSRNTIRKYLKSGAIEPRFATPERPSKLDPFAQKLAGWLKTEAAKGRAPARGADGGSGHLRAAGVPAGRGVPVRLERGFRDRRW